MGVSADAIADGIDCRSVAKGRWLTKYVAGAGGACLVLTVILTVSAGTSAHHHAYTIAPISLLSMSRSLRSLSAGAKRSGTMSTGASSQSWPRYRIGSSPLERLAILAIESSQLENQVRDTSMRTARRATIARAENDAVKDMDEETKVELAKSMRAVVVRAGQLKDTMAGVTAPMDFFDPAGFSTNIPEGRLLFFREAELKHGRVCMLASLGFLVGEQFHPLFGGNIDVPSYIAFQETPLETFWPAVLIAVGLLEVPEIQAFDSSQPGNEWQMRTDRIPGDLGFDPLGLKPKSESEFLEIQNKELNNGRLAMIAAAGMVAQEFVSGKKIF